jgi:nucleoside-diphosphate-sugar epimerase
MRVLVTGGAGFIGSNLVHELYTRGWTVDVVDDLSNGNFEFLSGINVKAVPSFMLKKYEELYENDRSNQVLFIEADFEDSGVLDRIRSGKYHCVFHLAANPRVAFSVEKPANTTDVNVTRTISLVEAIRDSTCNTRLVFSSTCAVYGDPIEVPTPESCERAPQSPYGLQKWMVEEFLKMAVNLYGIDAVSLRYYNVYGPRQLGNSPYSTAISAWCNRVKDGEPLRSDGDGEQTRDMVYVGDVVRANVLAASRAQKFHGDVINIGTGQRFSNNYILSLFKKKFGELTVSSAPARIGDVRDTQADNKAAGYKLGWMPEVTLEEGLDKTWSWWGLNGDGK